MNTIAGSLSSLLLDVVLAPDAVDITTGFPVWAIILGGVVVCAAAVGLILWNIRKKNKQGKSKGTGA